MSTNGKRIIPIMTAVIVCTAAVLAIYLVKGNKPDDPMPSPVLSCFAGPSGSQSSGHPRGSGTLRILASSELSDLESILDEAEAATGVTITMEPIGTLDGAQAVLDGSVNGKFDAVWFASNRYLELHPQTAGKLGESNSVMKSPVVLGLREQVATKLGWDKSRPTWKDIATSVDKKAFTYAMTNPAASNSGFSALLGVATALNGPDKALTPGRITSLTPEFRKFFAGQSRTAGSSGWLSDLYLRDVKAKRPVDGMFNYESVVLSLKDKDQKDNDQKTEKLVPIYPKDGVVTADYPITILNGVSDQARANYAAVVDYLRTPTTQRDIMNKTHRRPVTCGVALTDGFPSAAGNSRLTEMPFPRDLATVNTLVSGFGDIFRRPARTIYLLDTSGSMQDPLSASPGTTMTRLDGLKKALLDLTGADNSLSGRFARFNSREQVIIWPFNTAPGQPQQFDLPEDRPDAMLAQIRASAQALSAGGETNIYDTLQAAYSRVKDLMSTDPNRFTSIVLLSDGERTTGAPFDDPQASTDFKRFYASLPPSMKDIPTFTVLFGESNTGEMKKLSILTQGGPHARTFDARTKSLSSVFKEIRGYQ